MQIEVETNFGNVYKFFDELENVEKYFVNIIESALSIVVTRAKQIITEKGHIITGNLRRSLRGMVVAMTQDVIFSKVGSPAHYAYWVERLPDGGYLFQAFEEKFNEVVKYIVSEFRGLL